MLHCLSHRSIISGTSGAAKLLRANGITLLKVREEAANVLGKSEMFYFSPMHPPLTEAAQRALDWAVNEKLKSGNFCSTYELPLLFITQHMNCFYVVSPPDYTI
jgi:hypothetical protein